MEVLLLPLVAVAAVCIWYALLWLVHNAPAWGGFISEWFGRVEADIAENAFRRSADRKDKAMAEATSRAKERESRAQRAEFQAWLERELDSAEYARALDRTVLEARNQAPVLLKLSQEILPKTIRQCCAIHRLAAMTRQVRDVSEISLEPECLNMRERANLLSAEVVAQIERYPFLADVPVLCQNLNVIRLTRRVCATCPYLDYDVYRASHELCPSAKLVTHSEEVSNEHQQDRRID